MLSKQSQIFLLTKKIKYFQSFSQNYSQILPQNSPSSTPIFNYLLQINNQTRENAQLKTNILIKNDFKYQYFKDNPKLLLKQFCLCFSLGILPACIFPSYKYFFTFSGFVFANVKHFQQKQSIFNTIRLIELIESDKVNIYLCRKADPILCWIESIEITQAKENEESPYVNQKDTGDVSKGIQLQKDVSFVINVEDVDKKKYTGLNLLVQGDKEECFVENFCLLEAVLNGNVTRVGNFLKKQSEKQSNLLEFQSQLEEIENQLRQEVKKLGKN